MGQAYLESIRAEGGNLVLNVVLVTDSDKIPRQFVFAANASRREINTQIQSYLDQVSTAEDTVKSLQPGLLDLTVIPDEPPDPTPLGLWLAGYRLLQRALLARDAGAIKSDDPDLAELQQKVSSEYKAEYFQSL